MKPLFDLDYGLEDTAKSVLYNETPVAYGYGDVDALMKWIEATNKNQTEKALGIKEVPKYPLIWLVEGWEGIKVVSGFEMRKVIFHIAVNSNIPDLNENRKPQFNILYQVANDFIDQMQYRGVKVLPNLKYTKRANFSVTKRESHTIDIWDTLIIQTELLINTNCIKKLCGA